MSPKHSHSDHCTGHHKEDPGQGAGHPSRREPAGHHRQDQQGHNHQHHHRSPGWRGESPPGHHRSRHSRTRSGDLQQPSSRHHHNHHQHQHHRRSGDDANITSSSSRHTAVDTRHGSSRHTAAAAETTRNRPTTTHDSRHHHGNRTTTADMQDNHNNRRSRADPRSHNFRTPLHNNTSRATADTRTTHMTRPQPTPSITDTTYTDWTLAGSTGITSEYYAVRSRSWESQTGRGRRTDQQGNRSRRRSLSPLRTDRALHRHR